MKMDMDCIRDILLQTEYEGFTIKEAPSDDELVSEISFIEKYDNEKLIYHIELAEDFGLLEAFPISRGYTVIDLTTQGHLFLDDIRNNNVWNKTKEIANKMGISSLNSIKEIAINVASSIIFHNLK